VFLKRLWPCFERLKWIPASQEGRKDILLQAFVQPKLQMATIRAAAGIPPGLSLDAESPI
jgi:hypothetical protein